MVTQLQTPPEIPSPIALTPVIFHAIVDCSNCDLAKITDENNIKDWLAAVITKLELTAAGSATIKLTGSATDKEGYTVVQIVETGGIVAQFIDKNKHVYVDIFGTGTYNPKLVEAINKDYFGAGLKANMILLPRNSEAPVSAPSETEQLPAPTA